ncbi:MAG: helix-turn-helix domain-containing protein [Acidithiobacillus sp.]
MIRDAQPHSPRFKAVLALLAVRKRHMTFEAIAQEFKIDAAQLKQWWRQLLEGAWTIFPKIWKGAGYGNSPWDSRP